jgi:CRISPR-associated endonuclease Csn1
MPRRKVTGPAHKDTVKSPRLLEDGYVIVKRPLQDLTLKNIETYYAPDSDRLLYNAIVERLNAFGGDGKKAFAEDFHKPRHDGTPGPIVRKVKLLEPSTLNVPLHKGNGVADNEAMVRIDVFHVEDDGYYFVPIYIADTCSDTLPNRACVAHKKYSQWKEMNEEDFLFSLYPNDLVRISSKRPIKCNVRNKNSTLQNQTAYSVLAYYSGADISAGAISCLSHDGAYEIKGLGIKTLECIEKYEVDVLGTFHKISKEKRQSFTKKKKKG